MKKIFTLSFVSFLLMLGMADGQTHLWGVCQTGGTNGFGTIYTFDSNGNNLHSVYSMDSAIGAYPFGALVFANNKFYGVTTEYGLCQYGGCFSFDPNTNIFTQIHNFGCDQIHGVGDLSGMIKASDGKLYGCCEGGGSLGRGVIYRVDPATDTYADVYDFSSMSARYPLGNLIQLSDGKLYGMTLYGGTNGEGVIFRFNPFDSSFNELYSLNGTMGTNPFNGGLVQATDGKLYGMLYQTATDTNGVIFSYDLTDSIYTEVYVFDYNHGANPNCALILATNGLLYGVTYQGGITGCGVLFSFDVNTNTYTDLYEFNGTGCLLLNSLMQASNGLLFGPGGYDENIFKFNINTDSCTNIHTFNTTLNGQQPWDKIIEVPDSLTTGINPIPNKESITIYPNPAKNQLTISNLQIGNYQLLITDVLGNEVYHQPIINQQSSIINISQWSNGVYFYQLINNKETYRGKFVKE